MNKIKVVSRCFRLFFLLCFIVTPLLTLYAWMRMDPTQPLIFFNHALEFDLVPHVDTAYPISLATKMMGFLISLIPTAIHLTIFYFLIKLFYLYEQGIIFSLKNVNTIRNIGYALLVNEIVNPLYQALISLTMTWSNPSGHRMIGITLSGVNIAIVFVAILTILISWIMAEGYKLQEEQNYTI